jgi:hypothetical protein
VKFYLEKNKLVGEMLRLTDFDTSTLKTQFDLTRTLTTSHEVDQQFGDYVHRNIGSLTQADSADVLDFLSEFHTQKETQLLAQIDDSALAAADPNLKGMDFVSDLFRDKNEVQIKSIDSSQESGLFNWMYQALPYYSYDMYTAPAIASIPIAGYIALI